MKILPNGFAIIERDTHFGPAIEQHGLTSQGAIDWFKPYIKSGDTVIDVGAHMGTYTAAFLGVVGNGGTVYAFESNPEAYECLIVNCPTAKCFNKGVGKSFGKFRVCESGDNIGSAFLVPDESGPIEVDSLDNLLTGVIPSFIKIDVEGMECDVIEGANGIILSYHPSILVEYNRNTLSRNGRTVEELRNMLALHGYTEVWLSANVEEIMADAIWIYKK